MAYLPYRLYGVPAPMMSFSMMPPPAPMPMMMPPMGMPPPMGMMPPMGMPTMGMGMMSSMPTMGMGMGMQMQQPMGMGMQSMGMGMQQPMGMGMQQPMGMGMQQPMGMGMQQPMGMGMQQPMGFPVYMNSLAPNMYYKPIWSQKRENKLTRAYMTIMQAGVMNSMEIQRAFSMLGYQIGIGEAQRILQTLDRNGDGRISLDEFRLGVQQFIMGWPRTRHPSKPQKPHHMAGYNWTSHPMFPHHFTALWRPRY